MVQIPIHNLVPTETDKIKKNKLENVVKLTYHSFETMTKPMVSKQTALDS